MIACGQLLALPAAWPVLHWVYFIGTELENLSGLLAVVLGVTMSKGELMPSVDKRVKLAGTR